MVESHFELEIAQEKVILLPQRALFWPRKRWLVVSDLHWGKTEIFQRFGIRVPYGILAADLKRLGHAITITKTEKVFVLGDLIHHRSGIDDTVQSVILEWRRQFDLPMALIEGNHDRGAARFLKQWSIEAIGDHLETPPFVFSHDRYTGKKLFCLSGHLHPVTRMCSGHDKLRAPCFFIQGQNCILPAFSAFTGGEEVRKDSTSRVFPILEEKGHSSVIEF